MTHYDLILVGFGNVGRALARLLLSKQASLETQYDITFSITGIATAHHGMAIDPGGIDIEKAIAAGEQGGTLNSFSSTPARGTVLEFIRACPGQVLFENSPVNHLTGQPAIDHLKAALEQSMHAITANKGPVVHGYATLTQLAREKGRKFMFESAVMDGAPIFSLFRGALPAAEVHGFKGILNSCTNFILNRMEDGDTFDQAVEAARSIGITETDPSADIDGWDASIKVAALATVLMGIPLKPQTIEREGIRGITPQSIETARQTGKRWKLVCSARKVDGNLVGRVAPEMVSPASTLFSVNGTSSYVEFELDVLPGLGIVENNPGPDTTAYGLLADFINAVRS